MRIAVLNNLRAGRNSAEVTKILSLLRSYPDVLHIETDSARALPEALAEIARDDLGDSLSEREGKNVRQPGRLEE